MYKFKLIELNKLFENIVGNSKYTKEYCYNHQGSYKIYSANVTEEMALVSFYDFEGDNLSYTTRGNAGILTILNGKYSIGNNRAILKPRIDNIYLPYFKYTLEALFKNVTRQNGIQATTWQLIKNILVPVPINLKNQLDVDIQKEISKKYECIENMTKKILHHKDNVENIIFNYKTFCNDYDYFKVKQIFDLSVSTNNSKFILSFINENQGNIPVYGAVNTKDYASYGYVKDNLTNVKYFENCLTYNIDGEGACGYVFYREGRFSLSEKVRPLIINDEFKDKLVPIYLQYILHPIFVSKVRGRKINKTIIQDLEIPIPINKNGEIDILAQKEIAEKYQKLENIKEQVIKEIDKVLNISVEIQ